MCLSRTFAPLLKVFTNAMTRPTAASFRALLAGWLLAPRRTIIGMWHIRRGGHRDPQLSSRSHTVIRWGHCTPRRICDWRR